MKHKFFASMNWDALFRKEIAPPFKPSVSGDSDTSNVSPHPAPEATQRVFVFKIAVAAAWQGTTRHRGYRRR